MKQKKNDVIPILGMSPGNPYFNIGNISNLLSQTVGEHGQCTIMIPDIPAIATYKAQGYPYQKAKRLKALPKGNNLRNKLDSAMGILSYSGDEVRLLDWRGEIDNNILYTDSFKDIKNLCRTSKAFSIEIGRTTRLVIENALKNSPRQIYNMDHSIKIGSLYLIAEFALLKILPELLGCEKIEYIYHRPWPVYEKFIRGDFDNTPKTDLGFRIIK